MIALSMAKTAAATAAYALVHSALASRAAKRAAARLLGDRAGVGLYRAFYNAQSAATLVALVAYVRGLPDRELYRARGAPALALRGGQAACLAYLAWANLVMGPARFSGLAGAAAYARGDAEPPATEGHGPQPEADGTVRAAGPFRHTRHPVNLAATLVTWLNPRMTANLLAYNLAATAYFALGALREERRMAGAYGPAYEDYRRGGVPFYLPAAGRPR